MCRIIGRLCQTPPRASLTVGNAGGHRALYATRRGGELRVACYRSRAIGRRFLGAAGGAVLPVKPAAEGLPAVVGNWLILLALNCAVAGGDLPPPGANMVESRFP